MSQVLTFVESLLDDPAIQGPTADYVATIAKAKLDAPAQKALKDFCTALAARP
jgi:hypothetical protein